MKLKNKIINYIDSQYSNPRGIFGYFIGEKMAKQHEPETLWTIEQLKLQQNEIMLELGCGAGYAMKLLLEKEEVSRVVGLDLSNTILHSASIRNSRAIRQGKAKLLHSNVNRLPFKKDVFTRVYSIHSIYFWEKLTHTLAEIYRVLKPEGVVVLTLCDGKSGESWSGITEMIEQQVEPFMKKIGFRTVEILRGPRSREYHTVSVRAIK